MVAVQVLFSGRNIRRNLEVSNGDTVIHSTWFQGSIAIASLAELISARSLKIDIRISPRVDGVTKCFNLYNVVPPSDVNVGL